MKPHRLFPFFMVGLLAARRVPCRRPARHPSATAKFVVSGAGEAYDEQARGLNRKSPGSCQSGEARGEGSNNMALSQPERRVAVSAAKFLVKAMISVIVCVGSVFSARAQEAQPNNTNESWTATTETSGGNTTPSRMMESHIKSGNRNVDKQRVEVPGPNGGYQPDSETEKETVQVNATMTRTVERSYRGCEWT